MASRRHEQEQDEEDFDGASGDEGEECVALFAVEESDGDCFAGQWAGWVAGAEVGD